MKEKKKWSVNAFSTKVLTGDTIDRTAVLGGHLSHLKVLPFAGAKAVPSFLSHFKALSVGPIEPTTSPSAVKHSTNWTNPA